MAAHRYTAVLDACVLYPAPLRDLLLSLAAEDVYQAHWTKLIQDEWIGKLSANRPDLRLEALNRTAMLMNAAIKNGIVENFEHLIETLKLPDPDDRHVLAAAIASQASTIVTFNIKDFPRTGSIQAMHPDDFLVAQYALDPQATLNAIALLRRRLRKPPKSAPQLIATCDQLGLRKFCKILRKSIDQI